jgi:hypothetical protein
MKWLGREADHSPSSSAEVKNEWNYTSTPNMPLWRGAQLKEKHRDDFTLPLPYSQQTGTVSIF